MASAQRLCWSMTCPAWLRSWLTPAPGSDGTDNRARGVSPWIDLIHLLWALWIVIVPWLGDGFDRAWLISTLLSLPCFVALYLASFLRPRQISNRLAWAVMALSVAIAPWNPGASGTYFMFSSQILDSAGGRWRGASAYGIQLLAMVGLFLWVCRWQHYSWPTLLWLSAFASVGGIVTQVMRSMTRRAARLRLSESEVRRLAALAERERIGRDLHDLLGHTLSTITLKLELSRRLAVTDAVRSGQERNEAEAIARQALAEVRLAVTGIRATDLVAELAAARLLLDPAGVILECSALPIGLAPPLERSLALVLREAITNIARHAAASRAVVQFRQSPGELLVEVIDNGRGIRAGEGHGLSGMRERVAEHGGTLQLDTAVGVGTRVISRWPLAVSTPETIFQTVGA